MDVAKVVNTIIVFLNTAREDVQGMIYVLDRCSEHGITLHRKFVFDLKEVK